MQEWLEQILYQYANIAPLIIFFVLVIAALNIPISEDLTVIIAGIFVSNVVPQQIGWMHLALIAGAVGGDMLSYVIGRKAGDSILKMPLFQRVMPQRKLDLLSQHFAKHASLTILLGRLIPFGVRNALSLFSGITHFPVWKFLLLDTISGSLSISVIYLLSRYYSNKILQDIRTVQLILLLFFLGMVGYAVNKIWRHYQQKKHHSTEETAENTTHEDANVG